MIARTFEVLLTMLVVGALLAEDPCNAIQLISTLGLITPWIYFPCRPLFYYLSAVETPTTSAAMMATSTKKNNQCPPFVIEPTAQHMHSLILLHGLGSNGEKFGKELIESGVSSNGKRLVDIFPGAKFIFPTSRKRRSTAFGRAMLRQWFDVGSLDEPSHRQEVQLQGLAESSQEILQLINEESQKISRENIILGGLSQGCALGLACLLTLDFPLGGFIGMSGWLPFQHEIERAAKGEEYMDDDNPFGSDTDDPFANSDEGVPKVQDPIVRVMDFSRDLLCLQSLGNPCKANSSILTPVFLGHGEVDDKIKLHFGKSGYETLISCGFCVTWKSYRDQGHWYKIPDEIDDLVEFIREKVGWHMEKT